MGSTKTSLAQRLAVHRGDCRRGRGSALCKQLKKVGLGCWSMIEIGKKQVLNKREQLMYERNMLHKIAKKYNLLNSIAPLLKK